MQAASQLGERCRLDRFRPRISVLLTVLLTRPDVPRDLATARLPSTSGRNIVTLLCDMGILVTSLDQIACPKDPPPPTHTHPYCEPKRALFILKIKFLIGKMEM